MALSKPLFSHLKTLTPLLRLRLRYPPAATSVVRCFSFATPEEAAAERRRRKRRLRIEPPISSLRHQSPPPKQRIPSKTAPNPNAPKLPEPLSALSGKRLDLHNRILTLIREGDLDEASLLVRHSIYSNCRPTVFTCNAVLSALLRQLRLPDFLSLHRFITQAGVAPTVVTHNLLLQLYCDARKTDTALEHYRLLLKESPFNPSPTTYRILIKGLIDNSKLEQAVELKEDMAAKAFCPPDPHVYNLLMSGFLKNDDADQALSLFEELKDKVGGAVLDGIVYGNLMKAYFKKGLEKEAMDCYRDALAVDSKVKFNAVSYNLVLEALCKNGKFDDEALGLFHRMMAEHTPPRRVAVNLGSYNVMVDAYCALGRFNEAIKLFGTMGEKKCIPDALSYNNLIDQLGKNKLVAEAEELYREMGERGINPDEYTYVLLIESCFGVDRVDDAIQYFKKMMEVGLRPNANAYNAVIGGLVNVGKLDEARGFFDQMVEKEVKPNIRSYELLFKAFCEVRRVDDALKTAKGILMDDNVVFSDEMKELLEETLKKEAREEELGKLYEDVEREKAEAAARAAEEKARAEALAQEEEDRKKAEAAAKEAAAARASAAAIEAVLGRRREEKKEESPGVDASTSNGGVGEETKAGEAIAADGVELNEIGNDGDSSVEKEDQVTAS